MASTMACSDQPTAPTPTPAIDAPRLGKNVVVAPFHTVDRVGFEFDNDNDGIREDGDDIVMGGAYANQNTQYLGADFYRFNNGVSNQSDPVIDVTSAFGAVGTQGVSRWATT
jgi:hypothetical protein